MVQDAGRVVSLTTASKLGTTGPNPVAAIERIDTLVTDAPDAETQVYRDLGIEVISARTTHGASGERARTASGGQP
jgi:DeoR/GlpR family transcriptional regulator of sugar metabolism